MPWKATGYSDFKAKLSVLRRFRSNKVHCLCGGALQCHVSGRIQKAKSMPSGEEVSVTENPFVMTEEEKYYFDLRGYLVVHNAISQELVDACNASIDHFYDQLVLREKGSRTRQSEALSAKEGRGEIWGILGWPAPYRDPFRKLLIHPVIVSRLNELCGKRFRLDHGPWLITGGKGSDGQRLHGGGGTLQSSQLVSPAEPKYLLPGRHRLLAAHGYSRWRRRILLRSGKPQILRTHARPRRIRRG